MNMPNMGHGRWKGEHYYFLEKLNYWWLFSTETLYFKKNNIEIFQIKYQYLVSISITFNELIFVGRVNKSDTDGFTSALVGGCDSDNKNRIK